MNRVSEHLAKDHQAASSFHRMMAKCHGEAMGKAVAGNPEHTFHKSAVAAHEQAADHHDQMCEECQKVIASDLQKLQPTNVSAVAPTAPGVTAVPRAGQRPIEEAKPVVEAQFAKLLTVDEQDDWRQ
jgi:hypothetical protein